MPDSGIFIFIKDLLATVLGFAPPAWVLAAIAGIILFGLLILGIELIALAIKKLWSEVIQPALYNPIDQQRRFKRQMFADHIEGEIRILNSKEVWNDNRFTELEAYVEAEVEKGNIFRFKSAQQPGVRLQKSLSKAIERSTSRLVLLEGDPGAGKSVALRHVAQAMARKAHRSRNIKTRIPLYINLKYLQRDPKSRIDRALIEKFVLKNINRIGDRDIDEYLSNEFDKGLQGGTWLFLFDSFDEIPEILSSTGSDEIIRQYAEAIRDFLHGMNQCKGILASREYKGPRFLGWPMFRILPLTSSRRLELIKRTGLQSEIQRAISDGLALASADFRMMASNPMFLNLICEYMNKKKLPEFPAHIHLVFEEYIQKRLTRDEERLLQKFGKDPNEVKDAAEKIAFCMTSDQGLGLVPTIGQLRQSITNLNLDLGKDFDIYINSLAYLKIAKIEEAQDNESRTFTFSHRRFQEYFATSVVIRYPEKVTVHELITNGRWRETVVVILQTKDDIHVKRILDEISAELSKLTVVLGTAFQQLTLPDSYEDLTLPRYSIGGLYKHRQEPISISKERVKRYVTMADEEFRRRTVFKYSRPNDWPQNLYHILSLLQDGVIRKLSILPANLRFLIDKYIFYLTETGDILDRKWCLEISGIASSNLLFELVKRGFESKSSSVRDIAFRQLARIGDVPEEMKRIIMVFISSQMFDRKLFQNRRDTSAQLSRFENPKYYLDYHRLLVWLPIIDQCLVFVGIILLYKVVDISIFIICLLLGVLYIWIKWYPLQIIKILGPGTEWVDFQSMISYFTLSFGTMLLLSTNSGLVSEPQFWMAASCYGWGLIASLNVMIPKVGDPIRKGVHWMYWPVYSSMIFAGFALGSFIYSHSSLVAVILNEIPVIARIGFGVAVLFLLNFMLVSDWIYILPRARLILSETKQFLRNRKLLVYVVNKNGVLWVYMLLTIMFIFLEVALPLFLLDLFEIISLPHRIISFVVSIIFAPFVILFFGVGIATMISLVFRLGKETSAYYRFRKTSRNKYTLIEMLKIIQQYKFNFIKVLIIRYLSLDQKLSTTPADKFHLRNLIAFVDVLIKSENKQEQFASLQAIDSRLAKYVKCPSPKNRFASLLYDLNFSSYSEDWDENQLEELCKISEQLSRTNTIT